MTTSNVNMYINNEEVVCSNKFEIIEELTNTSTIILKNCYPLSWETTHDYISKFYMPKDYSQFKLLVNNELKFIGVIKRSTAMELNPSKFHGITLQVLDYKTFLNEGDQLNFVIVNSTIQSCIEQVLEKYEEYNFVLGNLNVSSDKLNSIVNNYNCNEKTPYDCLNYFANLIQAIWKTRYDANDEVTYIDFYEIDKLPKGEPIYYETEWTKNNNVKEIKYSFSSNDYRNKQIITADSVGATITTYNQIFCNGIDRKFTLEYPIYKITNAKLNNKTIRISTQHITGQIFNGYYNVGSNEIELVNIPNAGSILEITYYPLINGRQVVRNEPEINRIADLQNNKGVIARYENRRDTNTSQELGAIAQSYINFKGKEQITLTITTIDNDLWNIGDIVSFNNNNNDELINLQDNYVIKKKQINYTQSNADGKAFMFYTYTMVNNFNFESEINYFDNQRAKMIGNINEGEYINRYIDYTKIFNIIFDEAEIHPIDLEGNVLDAVLDFSFTK